LTLVTDAEWECCWRPRWINAGDLDGFEGLALHRRQPRRAIAERGLDRLRNRGRFGEVAVRFLTSSDQLHRR
jgi:hypothetical protein